MEFYKVSSFSKNSGGGGGNCIQLGEPSRAENMFAMFLQPPWLCCHVFATLPGYSAMCLQPLVIWQCFCNPLVILPCFLQPPWLFCHVFATPWLFCNVFAIPLVILQIFCYPLVILQCFCNYPGYFAQRWETPEHPSSTQHWSPWPASRTGN